MQQHALADSPLQGTMKSIDNEDVDLSRYVGQVVMIVNVASKCGLTPQYKQLQELYDKYSDQGFVVLAFPCNQFLGQEPGSAEQIKQFCSTKYNVTFPLFAKIDVKGRDASRLYQQLTSLDTQPVGSGNISWNFEKFLIGRDGKVIARFGPRTKPDDAKVVEAIETALSTK